ncbi:MAG: nucleotide exchange factor GrpE, partial [Planctomycetaceae bacterium]
MTNETTDGPEFPDSETAAAEDPTGFEDAAQLTDPAELQAQINRLQDQLLRGQAELENFRRRSQREADEARKY